MPEFDPSPFCASGSSFHREIDLRRLARVLADSPLPDKPRDRIVGPHDLHVLDQLRKRHRMETALAVPADYFVMALGDAPHRAMTKIGGLPYLPATTPWPERRGSVGDFYAQFNFADSKDIVPHARGDVLLVFRFTDLTLNGWSGDDDVHECLWVDMTDEELVSAHDVKHSIEGATHPWPAMHGYRARTFDDRSQLKRFADANSDLCDLTSAVATKIGGHACDAQSVWGPEVPTDYRFLCQVTGVWPSTNVPYPVANRAAPVGAYPDEDFQTMVSGPGDGITCFYLDPHGQVRVHHSFS